MNEATVLIDVWSDYVCPFCYLAEPALARIEQEFASAVEMTWRAFELRPEPVPTLDPKGNYLRDIWARAVYPMARERGMTLRLPPVQPRSRLAHEAAAFAREHGQFAAMNDALFRAFFEHGEDIGEVDVLAKLSTIAGLDEADLRRALEEGIHRQQVLDDEQFAQKLGVSGVPAMVARVAGEPIEQPVMIEGAQPYEVIHKVVTRLSQ
jgi:predicted DsbA family dithiol-disulfide isomerase